MPRENTVAKVVPVEGGYRWEFAHGEQETVLLSELTEEIQGHLMLHGLKQKGSDNYAGAKGDSVVAHGLFMKCIDSLRAGEWSGKREAGPKEEPIDLLIEAVVLVTKKDAVAVRTSVLAMDKATRNKLRRVGEIAKAIIDLRGARAKTPTLESFGLG
ncbi:MAG TPA: hypothetical protein VLH56_19095 [Dissulfurispiraceae bacterium]|nr:hypothetical protein [Dissulfurispiraceae bacterium]